MKNYLLHVFVVFAAVIRTSKYFFSSFGLWDILNQYLRVKLCLVLGFKVCKVSLLLG